MSKKPSKSRKSAPKAPKTARKPPSRRTSNSPRGSKLKSGKQGQLPGTEGTRYTDLDQFCEEWSAEARTMNAARKEANDIKDRAGKAMMAKNPPVHIYKHSNAAFSVTPGAAKVSARLVKDGGDASVQGGQTTSDAPQS